jgi:arabinose-5-phosphate isomerase
MDIDFIAAGRSAMDQEAEAVACAARRLDGQFASAVQLIHGHHGKIVVTGLGKSGFVAQKLAATLCSTGTPAVFLHPVDALHGDVGIYTRGDPTVLLSKSGTTLELLRLIPILQELNSPLIGILGNKTSPLAKEMDILLDASVRAEADPYNLAPTASAAVATALGDALALAVMQARKLTPEDFAQRHPAGQLGRNLRVTVRQVMHSGDEVAWTNRESSIKSVIIAMNRCPLGAACVMGKDGRLEGVITDGDLRRALQMHDDIRAVKAGDLMTARPVTIDPDATLREALRLMEDRPSQISVLPVVDGESCLGLVRCTICIGRICYELGSRCCVRYMARADLESHGERGTRPPDRGESSGWPGGRGGLRIDRLAHCPGDCRARAA